MGDAVLWDNRRVLHAGTVYDMERETRLMHRTTLQETEKAIKPSSGKGLAWGTLDLKTCLSITSTKGRFGADGTS